MTRPPRTGVLTLAGAVCAATALALAGPSAAVAADTSAAAAPTLRNLAEPTGLKIGTAVQPSTFDADQKYAHLAATQFSVVTAENAMKWESLEPARGRYTWGDADRVVRFAQANGQLVRGHTLVWHSQLPDWLSADGYTTDLPAAQLKALLKKHVQDTARRYRGQIWQWDVVNEAFDEDGTPRESVWYKAWGGMGYIADAFRWAHEADPKALLFYNDYNIEFTGPKSNATYAMVKDLRAAGVPIHGVGFQTHLATQYGFPDLRANLERFAALGVKVAETEVDVRTFTQPAPDVNVPVSGVHQSATEAYWSRALQACLAVKACISFTAWGIGDRYSWVPGVFPGEGSALLWDERLRPKPQYDVLAENLRLAAGAPRR